MSKCTTKRCLKAYLSVVYWRLLASKICMALSSLEQDPVME